ncbi:MAG TPA: plastocyanin/azurin family copper-binding protein [Acidimicrobiales bacterium]
MPTTRFRPTRLAAIGAIAAIGLGGAACAGDEGGASTATTAARPPFVSTVTISDLQFDPRRVEVAVGGSVIWVNDDAIHHLIVSTTPNVIDSPLIGKAGSYTRSFSTPGEYRYYCNIHNSLKGEVVVR